MNHYRARLLGTLACLIALAIACWLIFGAKQFRSEVNLRLSAGQPGGTYLPFAKNLKTIIEAGNPHINIEVMESEGSLENASRISKGEADLALVQNDLPDITALAGITPLYSGALHIVVRNDSPLKNISGLRQKRIGIGMSGSGTGHVVKALLTHYDISPDEVDFQLLSIESGFAALNNNEIDALMLMLGIGSEAVETAADQGTIRLLPIGTSAEKGSELHSFEFHYPFAGSALIPRFTYAVSKDGEAGIPDQPVPSVSIHTVLACRPDIPDRIVRDITRTIFQNRAALIRNYPPASEISESFDPGSLQFPLHEGAAHYLRRNEPGFLVKYAEVMGFSLSLLIAVFGFFAAMRSWMHQRQKDRIDEYYLQLNEVLESLEKPDLSAETLNAIHERLRSLRRDAVRQLAEERLQPDESFRIFQGLLGDCQARVRRMQGS